MSCFRLLSTKTSCWKPKSTITKLPKKRIAVEGNIAVGKTTFLKLLDTETSEWSVVVEPVSSWTNVHGDEELGAASKPKRYVLGEFYNNPNRWAYTFESYTFISRLKQPGKKSRLCYKVPPNPVQFFERSPYSSKYIFALNCYESGVMSQIEWDIYQDWSSYLLCTVESVKLDGFVYLRAEPEVCYGRMQKRERSEERGISLEYLKLLHQKHETLFYRKDFKVDEIMTSIPVLVIDCNEEFKGDALKFKEMMLMVRKFLNN